MNPIPTRPIRQSRYDSSSSTTFSASKMLLYLREGMIGTLIRFRTPLRDQAGGLGSAGGRGPLQMVVISSSRGKITVTG